MPNANHVTNTDRPLVRNPRHEDQAAELAGDEQHNAEARSIEEMRANLGRQADRIDAAQQRIEDSGMVSREELNQLLAKHEAEMRSIMAVFEMFKQNDPRREQPVSANVLEEERKVTEHTMEVLRTAPKESVYIVPLPYEAAAIEQSSGEPLYRVICINGVQYPVPVGVVASVPAPIAEAIHNARDGQMGIWRKTAYGGLPVLKHEKQAAQDLEQIPRPAPIPGSDEVGRSGVVGHDVFRPFNNEAPRALDVR